MGTLAGIVGAELPDGVAEDSHNQLTLWKGGKSARDQVLHNTRKDKFAIRKDNWLLIDQPDGTHSKPPSWFAERMAYAKNPYPMALYDLKSDISQASNLFAEQPDVVAELENLLQQSKSEGEVRALTR